MGEKVMIIDTADKKSRLESFFRSFSLSFGVIANRLGPVSQDRNIYSALKEINESISSGFAAVAAEIAKLQPSEPPPTPKPLEVTFVFKVANNHQDEPYSISIGTVTDEEGETLPDTKGLTVEVISSNEAVVAANFDPATNSGVAHFGTSGVASLNAVVKNAQGNILGSGAADFTVTTGDPAAVSDVKIAFGGLTEEPPAEPPA